MFLVEKAFIASLEVDDLTFLLLNFLEKLFAGKIPLRMFLARGIDKKAS